MAQALPLILVVVVVLGKAEHLVTKRTRVPRRLFEVHKLVILSFSFCCVLGLVRFSVV